jgi:Tfp pilus assembly protein PilO
MTNAELNALVKKHPLVVGCIVVTLASAVALYVRSSSVADNQKEYETKSAEAERMAANVRNAANLSEQAAEMQALRKDMESRLLKANQLAVNLQYFYKLETETEVKFSDVRQGATPRKTGYIGVPFSVSVQGTYPQLINFLTGLQNGRHLCRITSASFAKSAGADANGTAPMSLALNLELLGQP